MADELTERVRSLHAERLRPVPPPPPLPLVDLAALAELVEAIASDEDTDD